MWEIASADAERDPDEIVLVRADAEPLFDAVAVHVEPDEPMREDGPLPASLVEEINKPAHRSSHRIGIATRVPDVVLLGCLRHELEHVRQYDESDPLRLTYRMQPILAEALARAFPGRGLGVNYQLIPHEHDAHVAATALVRREHGRVPDELVAGTHRPLLDTDSLPVDGLPLAVRSMALAALVPDEVNAVLAEFGMGLRYVCEQLGVDFKRWEQVSASPEVMAARRRARELTPPPEVLEAAAPAERCELRRPARDALLEGYLAAAAALR